MFIVQSYTDEINKEARSRVVTVVFSDGVTNLTVPFRFAVDTDINSIKGAVKSYLNELNTVPPDLTGDITDVTEPTPTPVNTAREEWYRDRSRLTSLMELVRDGVFTGTETQIVNLKSKVKTSFKPEYLN